MRIVATDAFLSEVEKNIKNAKEDMSKVNYEQDKISDADEALEHAKAYWLMGYTWEEIDVILQDMEYPSKIVDGAIKKTQEYAQETLKDGPFKLKEGQLIKLENGQVVKAINFSSKVAKVKTEREEIVNVSLDFIDVNNSKRLTEAFNLREGARKLIKEAQGKTDLDVPVDTYLEPKRPERFELKITPTKQAPSGWAPYFSQKPLEEIEEADPKTQEALKEIEQLLELEASFEKELKELNASIEDTKKKMTSVRSEITDINILKSEEGKKIGSILGAEAHAADTLEVTVVKRFKNLLVAYRQQIVASPVGPVDRYDALIGILKEKVPDIFTGIMTALDEWEASNAIIRETLVKQVGVKEIKETDIRKKHKRAGIWDAFTSWISDAWNSVKATYGSIMSEDIPKIEELNNLLEDAVKDSKQEHLATSISKSLKEYIK